MKFYPAESNNPEQLKVALDDAMLLFENNPKAVLSACKLPEGASREDVRAKITATINKSMAEAEISTTPPAAMGQARPELLSGGFVRGMVVRGIIL